MPFYVDEDAPEDGKIVSLGKAITLLLKAGAIDKDLGTARNLRETGVRGGLAVLTGLNSSSAGRTAVTGTGKRVVSAASRRKMAAAQRAR